MIFRSPLIPEWPVSARGGRGREGDYFSDLTSAEQPRRYPYRRRPSMDIGYPRYPPGPPHPFYEWEETYDPAASPGQRHERRVRDMSNGWEEGERRHDRDSVDFDKACNKLFKQLEHAEAFYQKFQQDFDSDVTAIKKYAGDDILKQLWSRRIGVPGRRDSMSSEDLIVEWEEHLKKPCEKFGIMGKKIESCLEKTAAAEIVVPRSSRDESTMDSAKLLQDKIETAGEGIRNLLRKVYRSREYCSKLLKELDELKTLVKSRNSPDAEDEFGGSSGYHSGGFDQAEGGFGNSTQEF